MSSVLAQFKTNVSAWLVGSGNVIFIHLVRSLALCQQSVGCISHLNVSKTSLCHKRSPVMLSPVPTCTHTHPHTHIQLHYFVANLEGFLEDSLPSSVCCVYSTVTDLAKFLGKSTCRKIREAKVKIP